MSAPLDDGMGNDRSARRRVILSAYGVLAVAVALRTMGLADTSLRGDEVISRYYAQLPLAQLMDLLRTFWAHPPLFYLLFRQWLLAAGESVLSFRYIAFFAGVLVVPLTYHVTRLLMPSRGRRVGLMASLLAAINPFLISDSQDARGYSLLFALGLASQCCFLYGMRAGWTRRTWLAYVLCTTLAFYTHYLAVALLFTQGFMWLILAAAHHTSRPRALIWLAACLTVALLVTPWIYWALPALLGPGVGVGVAVTPGELVGRTFTAFTIGLAAVWTPFPWWLVALTVTGYVPFLFASLRPPTAGTEPEMVRTHHWTWRTPSDVALAAAYMALPAVLVWAFSTWRHPIYDERYVLLGLTGFQALVAGGFGALVRRENWRWIGTACLACLVLASACSLVLYHTDPQYSKGPYWTQFVQRVLQNAQPGDFLVQNYPDPALPYHLADRMPRILLPVREGGDDAETAQWLLRLSSGHSRIWFQPQESAWDPDGVVERWLDRRTAKVGEEPVGLLRLALYVPPPALLGNDPVPRAILGDGDGIELLGWVVRDIPADGPSGVDQPIALGVPTQVRADRRLEVVLLWRAERHLERSFTVFVHIYRPDGTLCAQQDNPPAKGTYTTDQWQAGEVVVDTYTIALRACASAGGLQLAVGMYDPHTSERLPVTAPDAALLPDRRVSLGSLAIVSP